VSSDSVWGTALAAVAAVRDEVKCLERDWGSGRHRGVGGTAGSEGMGLGTGRVAAGRGGRASGVGGGEDLGSRIIQRWPMRGARKELALTGC